MNSGSKGKWLLAGSVIGVVTLVAVVAVGASLAQASELSPGSPVEARPDWGRASAFGGPGWGHGFGDGDGRFMELLAEELGISLTELSEAVQTARQALIDLLVEEGTITEERAGLIAARAELREYLDPVALSAEALGMSEAELRAAREDGMSLREIIEEQELDAATYHENLAAAAKAAITEAVADGVITQDQADQLQNHRLLRFEYGGGLRRGPGFHPGRGGFHEGPFFGPPASPDDTNTSFDSGNA